MDCIITLAKPNILDCMPAGMPILTISATVTLSILSLLALSWNGPDSLIRKYIRESALKAFEIDVARATPDAVIPNPETNSMLRPTFKTPAIIRTISGLLVSPLLLKSADSKL